MNDYSIVKIATAIAASLVLVVLNMFFSTRKNPVCAFIMPVLSFAFSVVFLLMGINYAATEASISTTSVIRSFFILNIPTLVFIVTSLISRYLKKKL